MRGLSHDVIAAGLQQRQTTVKLAGRDQVPAKVAPDRHVVLVECDRALVSRDTLRNFAADKWMLARVW